VNIFSEEYSKPVLMPGFDYFNLSDLRLIQAVFLIFTLVEVYRVCLSSYACFGGFGEKLTLPVSRRAVCLGGQSFAWSRLFSSGFISPINGLPSPHPEYSDALAAVPLRVMD
jgi:hypothetical protein